MGVRQVTNGPAINHPTYFLQSSFFPGGHERFFTSYKTGAAQLWEVSLESGDERQLTFGVPIHPFSAALYRDHRTLVVTRGSGLWAIDRVTLRERRIVEVAEAELGECSVDPSGQWLTAAYKQAGNCGLIVGRFDGTD